MKFKHVHEEIVYIHYIHTHTILEKTNHQYNKCLTYTDSLLFWRYQHTGLEHIC